MAAVEIDVRYVAHLARLELTPEEERRFGTQLAHVLGHIEKLKATGYNPAKELNDRLISRMAAAAKL